MSLRDQFLVFQRLSADQLHESVPEQVWVVAVVEVPLEFIQVGIHMLLTELVVGADDRPLEKAPDTLHGVCVHICPDPFLLLVVDRLMPRVRIGDGEGFGVGDSHTGPDPVAEIPSRLVGHTDHALHLVGADTLLGFAYDVHGHKPLRQRQLGIVKDGACGDGEVVIAGAADELIALVGSANLVGLTAGTRNPFWPAQRFEVGPAPFLRAEHFDQFHDVHTSSNSDWGDSYAA